MQISKTYIRRKVLIMLQDILQDGDTITDNMEVIEDGIIPQHASDLDYETITEAMYEYIEEFYTVVANGLYQLYVGYICCIGN